MLEFALIRMTLATSQQVKKGDDILTLLRTLFGTLQWIERFLA